METPKHPDPDPELPKKKKLGTNRGIETLFRNTYRVHVELSALADSKANFLISVNSIVMVLIVSHGMEYVTHRALLLPVGIVMATCIGSMIFAVLVARPRIAKLKGAGIHSEKIDTNLLFFGSFTGLTKEEYITGLSETMKDGELLYPTMMADIYEMGKVLQKKFARLQSAYGFLLYGMPVGVIIFLIMQGYFIAKGLK